MQPLVMDIGVSGNNFRMEFDVTKRTHQDIFLSVAFPTLSYDLEVTQALVDLLKPGDTFIDIGAHIGWFTLLGARIVGPFGRVLAVEPDVQNYRCLKQHLKINDLNGSVKPYRMIVSNETGKIKLYLNQDSDGGHAIWPVWEHPENIKSDKIRKTTKVRSITLDELCKQEQITRAKLVKIDTEGAEGEILKGAFDLLSGKRIQYIVAEVNDTGLEQMGTDIKEITNMMGNFGYNCTNLLERSPGSVYNVLFSLKE